MYYDNEDRKKYDIVYVGEFASFHSSDGTGFSLNSDGSYTDKEGNTTFEEYAAYKHDKGYDSVKAKGIMGVISHNTTTFDLILVESSSHFFDSPYPRQRKCARSMSKFFKTVAQYKLFDESNRNFQKPPLYKRSISWTLY